MPSGKSDRKPRSKEDTWKADELQQSLKEAKRERRPKDGDRDNREKKSSRNHEKDDDRRRKHRSEEPRDDEERHRKHRSKEHRSRDGEEEDRTRKHRSKEHREDEEDRPRKHRSKDDRQEEERPRKHRSKDHREDEEDRPRKHRSKEHEEERAKKHRSREHSGEREEDKQRKHRSGEHRDKDRDRRDRDEDRERRRRERKERERDGSRDGSRHGSEDSREKRKEHRSKEHRERRKGDRDKEHRRREGERDGEEEKERKDRERRHKERRSKEERSEREEAEGRSNNDRHQGRSEQRTMFGKDTQGREELEAPEVEVLEEPENSQAGENHTQEMGGVDDYDDEEFEDYDDDFEESEGEEEEATGPSVRPSEIREIMEAMNQENATISPAPFAGLEDGKDSSGAYSDSSASTSRPTTGKGRTFINFVAAKQRQVSKKVATKTTKRGKELMRLLELDFIGYDILDIPPLTEYELYIRSFGSSNTQQVYTQCGEDNIDREVQTEEVEITQKWTQHPSSTVTACGDDSSISGNDQDQETKAVDTVKLTNFLNRSCQVVAVLLEEDLASRSAEPKRTHSNLAFSDNVVTLATSQQLLAGRHVVSASFSPTQPQLLLLAFSLPDQSSSESVPATVARRGLVCLWNISEPSRIQKVLMCEGTPTCCCFSPTRPTLAFAGTDHGSVVVWDLRELSSMHFVYKVGEDEWLIRSPTYTTDGILGTESHHGVVNSLVPVVSVEESHRAAASAEKLQTAQGGGLSFQLASMDEGGDIIFWTVIEVSRSSLDASETDLGLTPGGLIKIVKSSSFNLQKLSRKANLSGSTSARCLQLNLTDPNHFFVGTDMGYILHMVRHGGRALPRLYTTEEETVTEVTAMDFCPFGFDYFLVVCADGSVRLYNTTSEVPLMTWKDAAAERVRCVLWSRSRPSVFYTVDETRVRVWDLLRDDSGPTISEQLPDGGRVTTCALAGAASKTTGAQGFTPKMVVCTDSNVVQVHQLAQELAYGPANERERLLAKLQSGVFSG